MMSVRLSFQPPEFSVGIVFRFLGSPTGKGYQRASELPGAVIAQKSIREVLGATRMKTSTRNYR